MNNLMTQADINDELARWEFRKQKAQLMIKAGFLPKALDTVEKVLYIWLYGDELGLSEMAAIKAIDVIAGKPTLSPMGMLALAQGRHELQDIKETDDGHTATCTIIRRGQTPFTATFSMDDANRLTTYSKEDGKTIPLAQKKNWKEQPKVMRQWRAIGAAMKVMFPDYILGITPSDIVQMPESASPVTIETPTPTAAPAEQIAPPTVTAEPVPESTPAPTQAPAPVDPAKLRCDAYYTAHKDKYTEKQLTEIFGIKRRSEWPDWNSPDAEKKADAKLAEFEAEKAKNDPAAQYEPIGEPPAIPPPNDENFADPPDHKAIDEALERLPKLIKERADFSTALDNALLARVGLNSSEKTRDEAFATITGYADFTAAFDAAMPLQKLLDQINAANITRWLPEPEAPKVTSAPDAKANGKKPAQGMFPPVDHKPIELWEHKWLNDKSIVPMLQKPELPKALGVRALTLRKWTWNAQGTDVVADELVAKYVTERSIAKAEVKA